MQGLLPGWGWLAYRPVDLLCLGRPLTVHRGDVLDLPATATQPAATVVVLNELIPVDDEEELYLNVFEVDSTMRVIGTAKEIYVRCPGLPPAVIPEHRRNEFRSDDDFDDFGLGEDSDW